MRIAFIAPDLLGRSGYSRYARDLSRALQARGHQIFALVEKTSDASWCEEVACLSPPHHLLHPLICFWNTRRMGKHLQRLQPDIVHFIAEPYALTLNFLRKGGWRTCMTMHGSYAVTPFVHGHITRWLAKRAHERLDGMISVSNFTKGYLRKHQPDLFGHAHLEKKIVVLHNTIALPPSCPKKPAAESRIIMSVGAVKARKGYREAIRACARFREQWDLPFQYKIFGSVEDDPPYVEELRQQIRQLHLEDIVKLRGIVSDEELHHAYVSADLFLLLSLHDGYYVEGFGLVFLEANAWGVPVIGPNTGGCPEAIQHGRTGYVCDPRDTGEVASRMHDILIRDALSRETCRAWAEAHDIRKAAERIEEFYRGLLEGKKRV